MGINDFTFTMGNIWDEGMGKWCLVSSYVSMWVPALRRYEVVLLYCDIPVWNAEREISAVLCEYNSRGEHMSCRVGGTP